MGVDGDVQIVRVRTEHLRDSGVAVARSDERAQPSLGVGDISVEEDVAVT